MPRNTSTLMDKVDRAKQFGLAAQPVQQLASEAGRFSAPTTAVETGVIGGTPQQQAMAGTPAQKQAAVKAAAPTGETELERAQLFRTTPEATAEQQASMAKAKQLATGLGTFGAKVTEWVEGAKQKLTGQQAQLGVDTSGDLFKGVKPENLAALTDALKQVAIEKDPAKQLELENQINTLLPANADGTARTVNTVLNPEQKKQLYSSVEQSLGTAVTAGREAALGADKKLTVSDLTNLGTTPGEVATLLGISENDVNNMTIGQLQQKIAEESQKHFSTTQAIEAGLVSGALSASDRAALRQYLRDVEQSGLAGAETAVANIASDIDRGRQVMFGGKQYSVEELLESTALNDLVKQVLADPNGPIAKQLAQAEPDFAKWISDNKGNLNTLVSQSEAVSKTYGTMQQANKAALGAIGQYQPELAKEFGYDPDALRATKIDPAQLPTIFQYVNQLPKAKQETAATSVSQLNEVAGKDAVLKLSDEQLKKLDLSNPLGPVKTYLEAAQADQALQANNNIQDVIAEISTKDESLDELNAAFSGDNLARALGMDPSNIKELDTNPDGVIDEKDLPGIKAKFGGKMPSLGDFANGAKVQSPTNKWSLKAPTSGDPTSNSLFSTISTAIKDGNIDANERNQIANVDMNKQQLQTLINRDWSKVPQGSVVKDTLQSKLQDILNKEAAAAAPAPTPEAGTPGPGDPPMFFQVINTLGEEGKKLVAKAKQGDAGAWDRIAAATGVPASTPATAVATVRKKMKKWGF